MSKKSNIIVYTDGSCAGNGKSNAVGGIGIHFPNGELKDISKVFRHECCTNQRTELYGILTAIRYIKQNLGLSNNKVLIKTDSQYSIDCITKWVYGWVKNGWMTKSNTPVANKEFIQLIHQYYETYDIAFEHVDAHTGMSDEESVANAIADKLATMATKKAQLEIGGNPDKPKRTYNKKADKYPAKKKPFVDKKVIPKKEVSKKAVSNRNYKPNSSKKYPTDENIIVELIKAPK